MSSQEELTGCELQYVDQSGKYPKIGRCYKKPAKMVRYKGYPYLIAVCEHCFKLQNGVKIEKTDWEQLELES